MQRLATFAIRFRWPIVAFWVLTAIVLSRALPSLASVVQTNNAQFLPDSSPSQQAGQLAAAFQGSNPAGTAILVASRPSGPLTSADMDAFTRVEDAARREPGVEVVRDAGRSSDGTAVQAATVATAATSTDVEKSRTLADSIRATFDTSGEPSGLVFHLTRSLAVTVDSVNTNAGAITRLSLLFVVVLLFIVYRAALAPLVTLVPAVAAVFISGQLIAELAKAGIAVAPVAQQLLVVLLVGAGADYGLFLTFRMREEMAAGREARDALSLAMARVGQAITYSALTVVAALLTLLLAPFGIYCGLGPALALGNQRAARGLPDPDAGPARHL